MVLQSFRDGRDPSPTDFVAPHRVIDRDVSDILISILRRSKVHVVSHQELHNSSLVPVVHLVEPHLYLALVRLLVCGLELLLDLVVPSRSHALLLFLLLVSSPILILLVLLRTRPQNLRKPQLLHLLIRKQGRILVLVPFVSQQPLSL